MMMLAKLKTGLLALAAVGGLGLATAVAPRSIGADGQEESKHQDQPIASPIPQPPRSAEEDPGPAASAVATRGFPTPEESTVGIRIEKDAKTTFVRGTIIKSTPAESIVLTCARITYRVGNETREILPWTQPDGITVIYRVKSYRRTNDNPREPTLQDAFLHGELIDSDVKRNVALVRFRPREVLAASRIAPRSWKPDVGKPMLSIAGFKDRAGRGTAKGPIIGVRKGLNLSPVYEAIECAPLPDQAFFGSGLFTEGLSGEGNLLAGVYNFQSLSANTGIYAAPAMIYPILDKNGLSSLYQAEAPKADSIPEQVPPAAAPKPAEPPAAIKEAQAPAVEPRANEEPKPDVPKTPFKYIPSPSISTVQIRIEHEKPIIAAGTIIKSTPDESIVLTCARIFPPEAVKFTVTLRAEEKSRNGVQVLSSMQTSGEVIDRDLARNVALVRIRPGRVLSASPLVPRNWKPRPGTAMIAKQGYGNLLEDCSILGLVKGAAGNSDYEAIECNRLPAQSSTGSGLFTRGRGPYNNEQNVLAGVCNFSAPEKNTGLYASPKMIYPILDKNGLSSLYQDEDPNLSPAPEPDFPIQRLAAAAEASAPEQPEPPKPSAPAQPNPPAQQPAPEPPSKTTWSTTVRLAVGGETPKQALGTIIKSTPDEAIVLTCASIFHFNDKAREVPPSISVGLMTYPRGAMPGSIPTEACPGELIDVDPARNVALVRMRPGRKGPAARIVPPAWKPRKDLGMVVWNIQGANASPRQTKIIRPRVQAPQLKRGVGYEAIECTIAPKQSAVGGGLFVLEGSFLTANYLAGVCNFAKPESDAGLYAAPSMIYPILEKNGLSALYRTGNEDMNFAPEPDFHEPEAEGVFAPDVQEPPDADRVRKVEQRVDAIDGKLDEILRLLKKPD